MSTPTVLSIRRNTCAEANQGQTASVETLTRDAGAVLNACGVELSRQRISTLVRRYKGGIEGRGFAFVDYLLNAVQLTAEQRRNALRHPAIARVIAYADPTGETAVNNVMRADRRELNG